MAMNVAAAAALLLICSIPRALEAHVPSPDGPQEVFCPWMDHPECSPTMSPDGVRWRVTIRQPQDGAVIVYGVRNARHALSLLLEVTYDLDEECGHIECFIASARDPVVAGEVCMFDTVAYEIPLHEGPTLLEQSLPLHEVEWTCTVRGTMDGDRVSVIHDSSRFRLAEVR